MYKTSTLKTSMKKILFFLPLFFVSIATAMSESPASLRYLAAAKIPKNQIGMLPIDLQESTQNIQKIERPVAQAKKAAEYSAYLIQLKELCRTAKDSKLFEEIVLAKPSLLNQTATVEDIFKLCIHHSNIPIADYLFRLFPHLKKDKVMAIVLADSLKNKNIPMARYILATTQRSPVFTHAAITHALESEKTVNFLMPYIIKELQQEANSLPQFRPNTAGIVGGIHYAISSEKFPILRRIFLNSPTITNACQEIFYEVFAGYLSNIRCDECPRNIDTCKFVAKFLNQIGKQQIQLLLDRKLINFVESPRCNPDSVRALLELGANRLAVNNKGQIPFQILLSAPIEGSIYIDGYYHHQLDERVRNIAQVFLATQQTEQVRFIDQEGNTALHYPSAGIVIDLLEEHGGDMNALNGNGETPLSAFFTNNAVDLSKCNFEHRGYNTIFTQFFIKYLTMPICQLEKDKAHIYNQANSLAIGNYFTADVYRLLGDRSPRWHIQTFEPLTNATFVASAHKKITSVENPYNKFFSRISTILTNPKIPTYNSLHYDLKERESNAFGTSAVEKTIMDRMEDVD